MSVLLSVEGKCLHTYKETAEGIKILQGMHNIFYFQLIRINCNKLVCMADTVKMTNTFMFLHYKK